MFLRRLLALGAFAAVAVLAVSIATSLGGSVSATTAGNSSTTGTPSASSSASSSLSSTTTSRPPKPRPKPVYRGSYAVGAQQQTLVEPATTAGASPRTLPTTIMFPVIPGPHAAARWAAPKPFPLIVFSQGYATPVSAYDGLLQAWTKAGYVVAAPTYPDTSPPGPLYEPDIVNHPGDLSYVISMMIKQAQDPHNSLHRLVNTSEIAVAGQSDGGDVSLAVAANTCCIDHAVKAAVILSGAELSSFGGSYFSAGSSIPLLVTQGDQDTINPPTCSATIYDQAPSPKYFVNLLEQDGPAPPSSAEQGWFEHLAPYTEPGARRNYIAKTSIAFLDDFLKGRQAPLSALLAAGGQPNVATITSAPSVPNVGATC
ncbi:MAG: alpha/beta hydrolase family protein [Solirubrobacteraceae bacterium]